MKDLDDRERQQSFSPNGDSLAKTKGVSLSPPTLQFKPIDPNNVGIRDRVERERPTRERPEREEKGSAGPYGTPYSSWVEAFAAETFLKTTLIPAEAAMFGTDVAGLYLDYLNREKGDSLARAYFGIGSDLSEKFTDCEVMNTETDDMMRNFIPHLSNYVFPANQWASVSVNRVFGVPKLERRINYSNPFDAPGNIAGGDGKASSDAGDDVRYVKGEVHIMRVTDKSGNTVKYLMRNRLNYECLDCVDFIPGNPGAGMEQTFTIPLSRLEATNWAYDKPFQVDYEAPSKTIEISPSQIGQNNPQNDDEKNRMPEPRKEEERRSNIRR